MKFSVRSTRLIIATFMLSNIISALPLTKPRQSLNGKDAVKPIKNSVVDPDILFDAAADDAQARDSRNGLVLTIDSKIDFLQVTVDNCCATLNSKIDALEFDSAACCATLNSKLDNLAVAESKTDFDINSCCVTLNSKLDILLVDDLCAPVGIIAATTLTAAGTYCLAQNVTSTLPQTILINGSNIILNLNGHRLSNNNVGGSGVAIQVGAVNNVVIKNGFVQADASSSTVSSVGINLVGSRNVSVENVLVGALSGANNWGFGIQIQSADSVSVVDSQFHNNNVNGMAISSSVNVRTERCLVTNNGPGDSGDGIVVAVNGAPSISSNIYFVDCQVNNNFSNGLSIDNSSFVHVLNCAFSNNGADAVNVSNATCVELVSCSAERSSTLPQTEDGFTVTNSSDVVIKDCKACGFDIGYFGGGVAGVTSLNIINSIAKGNHIGFDLTAVNNTAIVQGCIADDNTNFPTPGVGFNDNGSGVNQYYSNRACNNDLNYNGVASAPITSPANDRGVMNVDCTSSQVDQVAQILSKVCVLDSKIDVITENTSKIDADLLNCCFTISSQIDFLDVIDLRPCCYTLESKVDEIQVTDLTILSHVDGVQDSLNACCFTISSQIDFLDVIDLRPCCFTIESKIDSLANSTSKVDADLLNCCFTLSSQIDSLDLDLAECCATLESKVDKIQVTDLTILSHVDGVQDSLNACCFTLSSQIDFLDVIDLRPCCYTLESKVDEVQVTDLTILSHVDGVQNSLNACCFTLSSQIDFLDVIDLRPCCYTLESKIDAITASTSKVDADLLNCCFTLGSKVDQVEATDLTILSHVDAVQGSLNACCFTLSSQIDFLDVIDLRPCCYTLESKIDAITVSTSKVDADLLNCCFTLGSKVDQVQVTDLTILSHVDGVQDSLNACCFTLSSQIDALDVIDLRPCCFTLESKVDTIQATDSSILSRVDALTNIVDADFAATFTALAALASQEVSTSSKVDLCCSTLNSKLDALNDLVVADFAATFTVLADVRAEETTIESKVDALTNIVNADFAGTFTVLAELAAQSEIDLCCSTLNSKLDALANTVVADFAATFTVLADVRAEETTIESKVDALTNIVNTDFAGTFTVLAELAAQSEIDLCCSTLNSKLDSLTNTVVADFAATFTALNTVQTTDNAVLSKLDVCCFDLNSKIDFLSNDNFDLGSKLDVCCYVVDSKVQFLIDNLLLP